MELTNEQWRRVEPIILGSLPTKGSPGRPPRDPREVLDGILWVMRTGAPWKDLPQRYPPYQTCHRHFQQWVRKQVFQFIVRELAEDLCERGGIDIRESFVDGAFDKERHSALRLATQSAAKVPGSWQLHTLLVLLSPQTWKALNPSE